MLDMFDNQGTKSAEAQSGTRLGSWPMAPSSAGGMTNIVTDLEVGLLHSPESSEAKVACRSPGPCPLYHQVCQVAYKIPRMGKDSYTVIAMPSLLLSQKQR